MRPIVYPIAARPDVEVSVDGTRWAQVQWSRAPGETMLGTFPATRVRQATRG